MLRKLFLDRLAHLQVETFYIDSNGFIFHSNRLLIKKNIVNGVTI